MTKCRINTDFMDKRNFHLLLDALQNGNFERVKKALHEELLVQL